MFNNPEHVFLVTAGNRRRGVKDAIRQAQGIEGEALPCLEAEFFSMDEPPGMSERFSVEREACRLKCP